MERSKASEELLSIGMKLAEIRQRRAVVEQQRTELDQEILLNWGSDEAAVRATETSVVGSFRFQGYNVYQLPTASASISGRTNTRYKGRFKRTRTDKTMKTMV